MYLETSRLIVRELQNDDAQFIYELLNSEAFIKNIGDRGVHTLEQAQQKIESFYQGLYPDYGLFIVVDKTNTQAMGTVSYLKRDYLEFDDIGYAFLSEFWGKGYALEATQALLNHKLNSGVKQVLGIVDKDNPPSIRLLEKLNFKIEGELVIEGDTKPILKMAYKI